MGLLKRATGIVSGVLREKAKTTDPKRSSKWPTVRKHYLAKHPTCAACGGKVLVQVHHKIPFHEDASLELHEDNLISLCIFKLCHSEIGHSGNYSFFNPMVSEHAYQVLSRHITHASAVKLAFACRKPNVPDGI